VNTTIKDTWKGESLEEKFWGEVGSIDAGHKSTIMILFIAT